MVPFGERLRAERLRLGFSQAQLAELSGQSRKSQVRYENGERTPDAAYLEVLSRSGVDALFVVTGVRSKPIDQISVSGLERQSLQPETLRAAIEAVEIGLETVGRSADAGTKTSLIMAAYELLLEDNHKTTAEIIRLVQAA